MFDSLKSRLKTTKAIADLDEVVVRALFAPAVEAGACQSAVIAPWTKADGRNRADNFIRELLPLSEYYQTANPVLSAAVWGTWNALDYLRRQRSINQIILESRGANMRVYVNARALVATAAIQFSDGNALTAVTSNAMDDFASYRELAEAAIKRLSLLTAR